MAILSSTIGCLIEYSVKNCVSFLDRAPVSSKGNGYAAAAATGAADSFGEHARTVNRRDLSDGLK